MPRALSSHHNDLGIPNYDFGDKVLYRQTKPEKRKGDNDITILLVMCAVAFLILGGLVLIKITPGTEFKLGSFFSAIGAKEHPGYTLGSVKLGTTMDVLRLQQPHAQKGITASGAITLAFDEQDAQYTVWYGEDGPYHIAYKARQSRIVTGMSEDDYIGEIAKRFGAPSVASCTRRITDGMRDCRFSWWMPGELRLDLNSRQDLSATTPRLMITLITTDTRLEGRLQRNKSKTSIQRTN